MKKNPYTRVSKLADDIFSYVTIALITFGSMVALVISLYGAWSILTWDFSGDFALISARLFLFWLTVVILAAASEMVIKWWRRREVEWEKKSML